MGIDRWRHRQACLRYPIHARWNRLNHQCCSLVGWCKQCTQCRLHCCPSHVDKVLQCRLCLRSTLPHRRSLAHQFPLRPGTVEQDTPSFDSRLAAAPIARLPPSCRRCHFRLQLAAPSYKAPRSSPTTGKSHIRSFARTLKRTCLRCLWQRCQQRTMQF